MVSPNCSRNEFDDFVDALQRVVYTNNKRIILLGDFNSKYVATGINYSNWQGRVLTDILDVSV